MDKISHIMLGAVLLAAVVAVSVLAGLGKAIPSVLPELIVGVLAALAGITLPGAKTEVPK